MEKLYKIKEALWSELDKSETAKSGELKGGELEAIHKLTDAIKNIDKICMLAYEIKAIQEVKPNHLAAAEMSVEGNYNQIDGIINNKAPLESENEALYLVGGAVYLHVQTSEDDRDYTHDYCFATYDYTLYDKETMRQLDSGRMEVVADIRDTPNQIHRLAAQNILEYRTLLGASSIEPVSMDILDTLHSAVDAITNDKPPKPSLLAALRQCQEDAGKSQGGTAPPCWDPER